ncbi:hypothetical protein DL96DRAFT_1620334 [Flagelloscypha sp. PMI_526]|nr:hypothetical protein DL96DRAFT_1620334 [Flagelloscypha sp. PMI_526]
MALNWAMLNPDRTPVPLPSEDTITTVKDAADIVLVIPNAPPSGSDTAGGAGGSAKFEAHKGNVYITSQRLIYTTPKGAAWESISIPLTSILSTRFHQPTFSGNYLSVEIKPSPDGGLTEGTNAEIRFRDTPMLQFIAVLDKTREKAIYMKRDANDGESLRMLSLAVTVS